MTIEILLGGVGVTSILPATGITGWTVTQDPAGAATVIPITSAYRKGASGNDALTVVLTLQTRLTALQVLKVSYAPGNLTAQDATPMATYAGSNGNCTNYTGRPMFLSAATTLDGRYVDVRFQDYDSTAILPSATSIPGFTVKKNGSGGTTLPYSSAVRKGNTGEDAKTVRITLVSQLDYTDTNLVVNYVPDVTTFITDNEIPVVPTLAFDYQTVTQNTVERLPPTYASAYTSASGLEVYVVFNEPPSNNKILPESTNIAGFTVQEDPGGGYVSRTVVSAYRSTDVGDPNYQRTIIITLETPLTRGYNYKVAYAHVSGKPKVTDAVAIPNELAPFTSSPISNTTTTERVVPTFTSASVATTTTVVMSFTEADSQPLIPINPSGFTIRANGSTITGTIARTANTQYTFTRTSGMFSGEDYVTVQYVKPTSNFVTDSSSNALASFGPTAASNLTLSSTAPVFIESETSDDGEKVKIYIRENRGSAPYLQDNGAITPLPDNLDFVGFYVQVNSIGRDIIASELGASVVTSTDVRRVIELTLAYPIKKGDVIRLDYIQANGNVEDTEGNNLANITNASVANKVGLYSTLSDSLQFFDPVYWPLTGFSDLSRSGYLLERRHGWPLAKAILDTTPPVGDIVINENPGSGGIFVHHFAAYGSTEISNSGGASEELNNAYEATQFTSSGTYDISSIGVKLKKSGTLTNQSERITVSIYTDASNKPGTRIATSTDSVSYGSLTDTFVEKQFEFDLQLSNATKYWIVVNRSAAPSGSNTPTLFIETKSPASGEYATSSDASAWTLFTGKSFAYTIYAQDANAQPQAGYDEIRDPLDIPVKQATAFGGADNEAEYEVIGTGDYRSMVKRLTKVDDEYPEIRSIEVGMTANRPKAYQVDARVLPTDEWSPLFTMIADSTTRDYFRYTFAAPIQLAEIRVRYRGDFYASSNDGEVTVSATDPLTDVVAMQVSHYTDFHDATDFPGADSDGWVSFTEGTSIYDWELVDEDDMYIAQLGAGTTGPLRGAFIYGSSIIAYDDTKIYKFTAGGTLTATAYTATLGVTIESFTVLQEIIYVGLSNGRILKSVDGQNYVEITSGGTAIDAGGSVTSLAAYRNKVWVGTGRTSADNSRLYTLSGSTLTLVRTFEQPVIRSMAVAKGNLFVGTGTDVELEQGSVYYYDGQQWSLTLDTDSNGVDSMVYSTGEGRLWVALEGGSIYALEFDENSKPKTWKRVYDGDATHYLHLSDDPNGQYVWACGDTGLVTYNIAKKTFLAVPWPSKTSGLNSVWTNSDSTNFKSLGEGSSQVFYGGIGATAPVDWANLTASRPTGVNSTYINTVWTGYIKNSSNAAVTFDVVLAASDGARLYIDNQLVIDAWDDQLDLNGVFNMIADKYVSFRLEYYHGTGNGTIQLRWTPGPVIVPTTAFGKPNTVNEIAYIGSTAYAAVDDSKLYKMDVSSLATKKRTVYARFKDAAGNATPLPGISDSILQDAPTSNGVRTSDGNIFQVSNTDKSVVATFASPVSSALKAPIRKVRQDGYYESEPFYSPTLTRWDKISFLATMPAGTFQGEGLEQGVEVTLQVRTGDTREECLAAEWGSEMTYSTIDDPGIAGSVDTALNGDFNISTITKKWLQYKLTMVTASKNVTPEVKAVILSFVESKASYFFTTLFDTESEAISPYPQFRRGLLTANMAPNGGSIRFGYTTDDDENTTFNFARYTEITPNTVFELPTPSQKIRFGILFVSVMSDDVPTTLYPVADCLAATTGVLPSTAAIIYNNGAAGVGATLTRGENGALGTIDGVTLSAGNRVLVKDQADAKQNGVYTVTNAGSGGAPYVLTRATDSDQAATEMRYGLFVKVTGGTENGEKNFFMKTADPITMGTSNLAFAQFTPAVVDDFAVQLDAGTADMKFMD